MELPELLFPLYTMIERICPERGESRVPYISLVRRIIYVKFNLRLSILCIASVGPTFSLPFVPPSVFLPAAKILALKVSRKKVGHQNRETRRVTKFEPFVVVRDARKLHHEIHGLRSINGTG